MTIKFMGVQDDPDMDNAEGRGFPRIYDGTKRSLLDDVRSFVEHVANEGWLDADAQDRARQILNRIDGGER